MQFIRLLAFAMALAIANLPVVWAEPDVRDVVNNPAFLSKYVADAKLKKGSCAINYWGSLLSIPGEQPIQSINGFWPYTDKCADLAPSSGLIYSTGTEPAGSGQIIIRTSEAHQPELSGQLSLFLSWYKKENRAGRQDFHHYRSQWYASATPTPLVNQPITSGSNQAIFGLGWFGEEIDVTFSDSTLYPTTITKFTADRGGGFGQDDAFWKKYVEGKGGSLSMNTDSGFAWGDAAALTGVAAATAAAATVVYTAAAIMLTTATTFAPLGPIGWIVIGAVAVVTFVLGGTTKMYQDTNRFTSTLSTIPNTIIPYTLPSTFQ